MRNQACTLKAFWIFNAMATLSSTGTGYAIPNGKHYDTWGKVRYDGGTGSSGQILNPDQRYCGNLGHKYDATNGLVYMRARYYEAATGRFISEDPVGDGQNWYSYCRNMPSLATDSTGTSIEPLEKLYQLFQDIFSGKGPMSFSSAQRLLDRLEGMINAYVEREEMLMDMNFELMEANLSAANRFGASDWERTMHLELAESLKAIGVRHGIKAKIAETFGLSFIRICRELLIEE